MYGEPLDSDIVLGPARRPRPAPWSQTFIVIWQFWEDLERDVFREERFPDFQSAHRWYRELRRWELDPSQRTPYIVTLRAFYPRSRKIAGWHWIEGPFRRFDMRGNEI